jgi:hypothetical protein
MQSADVVFVTDQCVHRLFLWRIQSVDVDNHILTSRDRIPCAYPRSNQKNVKTPTSASVLRHKRLIGTDGERVNQQHTFWSIRGRWNDRRSVHIPRPGFESSLLLKRCRRVGFLPQDRGGISRCGEYQVIGGRRERADLFRCTQRSPVNASRRSEERDVRPRSVGPKMPIVCKALEIERWRGLVSLVDTRHGNCTSTLHTILFRKKTRACMILLSMLENVHHSNEPHDLGNTSEGRVDTEVQNYAMHHYFIYCEGPNALSPNHEQDPATIERVEGVRKEKHPRNFSTDGDRAALGQGQDNRGTGRTTAPSAHSLGTVALLPHLHV